MSLKRILLIAVSLAFVCAGTVRADPVDDLKAQMEILQKQLDQVKTQLYNMQQEKKKEEKEGGNFVRTKPGNALTFLVGGGEVTLYGHVDVSLDDQTSGLSGFINNGKPVTGRNGWVPDISSNLSNFGVRGQRPLSNDLKAVFQFETEVAYAATPGASDQAPDGTAQKFSLGSRNSFIGLQSTKYGAIKLGKTDTPYKTSTGRMDPLASTPGDYNAIMGNSGGDNRAEFDARLPHSIWYESPKINNFNFNFLVSPGQNKSTDTQLYALGEPDCAGGNSTGGLNGNNGQPGSCEDGSSETAFSTTLVYQSGPLYAIAGFERHNKVNRKGDETVPGTVGIRDESAYKVGVQYAFPTKTTVSLVVERLKRDAITPALDERTRTSEYVSATQAITPVDFLNAAWAHAGRTPGQPDQGVQDKDGIPAMPGSSNNSANLYAFGYKHYFGDRRTTFYLVYARLVNEHWGHFSLGAGGHGLPTRNYVGDKFIGGCADGGNCGPPFSGNTAQAFSVGLTYDF